MPCSKCHDTKEIRQDVGHSVQVKPCPECVPPLKSCDGNKTHVLISGYFWVCPVCAREAMLRAYRAAEKPQPRMQTNAVSDGKRKVTIAEEIKGEPK